MLNIIIFFMNIFIGTVLWVISNREFGTAKRNTRMISVVVFLGGLIQIPVILDNYNIVDIFQG